MKGEIRLLGCILAQTPEAFYNFYPGAKTKRDGALDYWNRMLGEDKNSVDEYRRKQRERSKAWRDRKKKMSELPMTPAEQHNNETDDVTEMTNQTVSKTVKNKS